MMDARLNEIGDSPGSDTPLACSLTPVDSEQQTAPWLGPMFAKALATRDFDWLGALLHPTVDFSALTPRRAWSAQDGEAVIRDVLREWFPPPSTRIEELVELRADGFAGLEVLRFRLKGHQHEAPFLVDQQAYLSERDRRIGWMRMLCSGLRPDQPSSG